jgi:hypothetical protein
MEIHVPRKFTDERPAIRFSHLKFVVRIEEHPVGCRLLKKTGEFPSIQDGYHRFKCIILPENLPDKYEDYFSTDEPLISLHIASFANATLVSISHPHTALDAMGTSELIRAWSSVLEDRLDYVPTVLGAREDVMGTVGTILDEKAQSPYFLQDKQIKGLSKLAFVIRLGWELLTSKKTDVRTIFLPAKFMSQLRQKTQDQLSFGSSSEYSMFLSDGDLITVWLSRMIISSCSKKRSTTICLACDLRSRLKDTFTPGGSYLQNLVLLLSVFLPAEEVSTLSIGQIVFRLRQAIVEQATDMQARSLMRVLKTSYATTAYIWKLGLYDHGLYELVQS